MLLNKHNQPRYKLSYIQFNILFNIKYILLYHIHLLNVIKYKNSFRFHLSFYLNTDNLFKTDQYVILRRNILTHTTKILIVRKIVNTRELIITTTQIFLYNLPKVILKWFHTFIPRHPRDFES